VDEDLKALGNDGTPMVIWSTNTNIKGMNYCNPLETNDRKIESDYETLI
jgi:hypothetical protein